ncbi:MAG: ECF transporter S component [Candidatus Bathyarchaeota archaeon]|nr:ECF transporter S component [Candidatus Termiticorpusculum sp.]
MRNSVVTVEKWRISSFQLAVAALFAALVAVVTLSVHFPLANGYFNFGEVVIYSAALLLGPFVGLVAGAGAAIADVVLSPGYALATFIIKAVEGFLVGYLIRGLNRKIKNLTLCASVAVLIGGCEMVVGYFVYDLFVFGYFFALYAALFNIVQMLTGLIIAIPIMHAVLRVFPQLRHYIQ